MLPGDDDLRLPSKLPLLWVRGVCVLMPGSSNAFGLFLGPLCYFFGFAFFEIVRHSRYVLSLSQLQAVRNARPLVLLHEVSAKI